VAGGQQADAELDQLVIGELARGVAGVDEHADQVVFGFLPLPTPSSLDASATDCSAGSRTARRLALARTSRSSSSAASSRAGTALAQRFISELTDV
jgi:hypothetical protein